jgi:hypothetical protein
VGVRFDPGEFRIRSQFEQPVVLQPTAECSARYPSHSALFKGCEGAAMSGVFYATGGLRETCGCAVFTKFDGASLSADCFMGFATAAAIACLRALGLEHRIPEMDMQGWEEI